MIIRENLFDNQIVVLFDCGYKIVYTDHSVKAAAKKGKADHNNNCPICGQRGKDEDIKRN
jgi:hypothetical protein